MEKILILRKSALASLAICGFLLIALVINDREEFRWFGLLAHMSLSVFVATESFGPLAQQRSIFGRSLARLFLGMYVLAGTSAILYILGWRI
jgi:hypothetical protein